MIVSTRSIKILGPIVAQTFYILWIKNMLHNHTLLGGICFRKKSDLQTDSLVIHWFITMFIKKLKIAVIEGEEI